MNDFKPTDESFWVQVHRQMWPLLAEFVWWKRPAAFVAGWVSAMVGYVRGYSRSLEETKE